MGRRHKWPTFVLTRLWSLRMVRVCQMGCGMSLQCNKSCFPGRLVDCFYTAFAPPSSPDRLHGRFLEAVPGLDTSEGCMNGMGVSALCPSCARPSSGMRRGASSDASCSEKSRVDGWPLANSLPKNLGIRSGRRGYMASPPSSSFRRRLHAARRLTVVGYVDVDSGGLLKLAVVVLRLWTGFGRPWARVTT